MKRSLDDLIRQITADAHGEDEQFRAFRQAFHDNVAVPCDAFVIGEPVKGGQYGNLPSLTDLDDGNLKFTTDYRRMYATLIGKWMGHADTTGVLRGNFDPLPLIGA